MRPGNVDDGALAFSTQLKTKKPPKGDRSSKEPSALCHLPAHGLSMHTNAECRSQNLSSNQNRPVQQQTPRPMGRTNTAPPNMTSRGLSAISALTDADKARLFDHLQTAHANSASTPSTTDPPSSLDNNTSDDRTVYFSNVYSAVVQSKSRGINNDEMVLDTGADQYIFHSSERFISMSPISPISIKTADGSCHMLATHQGNAVIESYDDEGQSRSIIAEQALYCRDISVNLISAARLCDAGCTFKGDSTTIVFQHPNGGELHARRQSNTNELWTVRPRTQSTCMSVSTDIMHQRLGHLHSAALQRFCKHGGKLTNLCTSCVTAKSSRHPFRSSLPRADRILYRIHSDVVGPLQTPTPNGNKYFVSFIDEYSRHAKIYLMKHKSEVFDKFKEFLAEAERHTGQLLCILKCDRGGEYSSSRFLAFTSSRGIRLEQGPAHTPEHNSVAERYNRTIMERSRAQMIHAAIPKYLWGEVVMATSLILNMSPTRTINDIPVNVWQQACAGNGAHFSDHSFLRVIGCQAFVHIPKSQRRKLDRCAEDLIHIGYEPGSKSYRLWNPSTKRIVISRDVTFNESSFPLRDQSIHQIPSDDDESDDDLLFQQAINGSTGSDNHTEPSDPLIHPSPPPSPSSQPSPSPSIPEPPSRPSRSTRAPTRYGNIVSYAAVTRGTSDADNPTYAQAMASADAHKWRAAMQVEFDSLVSHSVGRLIKRPSHANVLGGMWRFKRKRDTSGAIVKYKARWVILGNHQIH